METKTKSLRWLLPLLSALFLLSGLTACDSTEDSTEGSSNPMPEVPVNKDDWQTVPASGGTITKDSISITFPSGTFVGDTKVAITEVKKGLIGGDYEVSPFYKIVMPSTTNKAITIRTKCKERGNDIRFVTRENGAAMSYDKAVVIDSYINASYSNGEYVATLPPIENGQEISVDMDLIMGVSHVPQDVAATRGTTLMGGQVGNIKWEITYPLETIINLGLFNTSTHTKVEKFKPFLNDYVKEAIKIITGLGFKIEGKRTIPIYIESLPDRWGQHNQSTLSDTRSSISISYQKMSEATPDTAGLRSTIIHELFHYFQSEYDPRPPIIKGRTSLSPTAAFGGLWSKLDPEELVGDEVVMYEMGAVWIEHFMNNGQLNAQFLVRDGEYGDCAFVFDQMGFIDILGNYAYKNDKKSKYQTHGYSMAPLLFYITEKLDKNKIYGIDNSFVLELHNLWKSKFATIKFASTAYNCLTSLVDAKGSYFFYCNDEFEDYVIQLLNGKLIKGFYLHTHNKNADNKKDNPFSIKDAEILKQDEGDYTFKGSASPFGCSVRLVTLQGLDNKDLSKKSIVVKQETEGMKTFLLITDKDSNFSKFTQAEKAATTKDSIVINGSKLEKMRLKDKKFAHDFFLVTIRTDCTPSSRDTKNYNVTFKLKNNDVSVEPDTLKFSAEGDTKKVLVNYGSYKYYGYKIEDKDLSWISAEIDKTNGVGVKFTVTPNTTTSPRETTVYCFVANEKNSTDAQRVYLPVKIIQKASSQIQGVSLNVSFYISMEKYEQMVEEYLGGFTKSWGNDINNTQIVVKKDGVVHVTCSRDTGVLSFDIDDLNKLKSKTAKISNIKGEGNGWGIAAKGTSNNSYLENGNSITCTWDIGEISYSYASTVPSLDKSYCEGEISITIPK